MKRWILCAALAGCLTGTLSLAARAVEIPMDSASDLGTDETLLFVIAGEYDSLDEAHRADARIRIGELQGFYPIPAASIEGASRAGWVLATAFRTERGASEFEELARAAAIDGLRRVVARYRGTAFVGLGQEPHPTGDGPLVGPLPAGHPARLG